VNEQEFSLSYVKTLLNQMDERLESSGYEVVTILAHLAYYFPEMTVGELYQMVRAEMPKKTGLFDEYINKI
jgi:hypothetical protein